MDDKAYLRPETSEGAKGARQQTILQPLDENRARSLPVHDFPEASVYITPSAFRFIRKETEVVKEEVTLVTKTDDSIVVVEPKAYAPVLPRKCLSQCKTLRIWIARLSGSLLAGINNRPRKNAPSCLDIGWTLSSWMPLGVLYKNSWRVLRELFPSTAEIQTNTKITNKHFTGTFCSSTLF